MIRALAFLFGFWIQCCLSLACILWLKPAGAADRCLQFAGMVAREAQAIGGPDAPWPLYLAQARQESSCRPEVTASDGGRGLMQFMDGTSRQVTTLFPEIGPPNPYSPQWAFRAEIRYNGWIYRRVRGADVCNRWGATLKGYNAGPGYVLQAQQRSAQPEVWFGVTEFVPTRQAPANFEASRLYSHKIIFGHQRLYAALGPTVCLPRSR